jgi:uncharacterized protein YutE (UPF0331/DUF86 family)
VEGRHIEARLRRLVVDYRALKAAVDEFGPALDRDAWQAVFESEDPADVNRVAPIVSAYERIVNGLIEAARSGLVASGATRPLGTPEGVRADLERVRDEGGLTDSQAALLIDLSRTRNELQHTYIDVSADDVREAIRRLRTNLPAIVKELNAWFGRSGVGASRP